MNYLDELMERKGNSRLDDLKMADLKMYRQNLADSLNCVVSKINNFQQKQSATYYQLRFNYTYINRDLYKEETMLIINEFTELGKRFEEVLNQDPRLKEDIVLIKAELLEKAEFWNRARREVDKDLIERRRAGFWKKTDKEVKQYFSEADLNRLRVLEKMYGNKKGLECLQHMEEMMAVANPSINFEHANKDNKQPVHSILDKLNELTNRKGSWRLKDREFKERKEVKPMERM